MRRRTVRTAAKLEITGHTAEFRLPKAVSAEVREQVIQQLNDKPAKPFKVKHNRWWNGDWYPADFDLQRPIQISYRMPGTLVLASHTIAAAALPGILKVILHPVDFRQVEPLL